MAVRVPQRRVVAAADPAAAQAHAQMHPRSTELCALLACLRRRSLDGPDLVQMWIREHEQGEPAGCTAASRGHVTFTGQRRSPPTNAGAPCRCDSASAPVTYGTGPPSPAES